MPSGRHRKRRSKGDDSRCAATSEPVSRRKRPAGCGTWGTVDARADAAEDRRRGENRIELDGLRYRIDR